MERKTSTAVLLRNNAAAPKPNHHININYINYYELSIGIWDKNAFKSEKDSVRLQMNPLTAELVYVLYIKFYLAIW